MYTPAIRLLSEYREGDRVMIDRIEGSGAFRRRMLEMGFTKGSVVHVIKYAPLRDPLELTVKQSHVSIRVEEAGRVYATALLDSSEKKDTPL